MKHVLAEVLLLGVYQIYHVNLKSKYKKEEKETWSSHFSTNYFCVQETIYVVNKSDKINNWIKYKRLTRHERPSDTLCGYLKGLSASVVIHIQQFPAIRFQYFAENSSR